MTVLLLSLGAYTACCASAIASWMTLAAVGVACTSRLLQYRCGGGVSPVAHSWAGGSCQRRRRRGDAIHRQCGAERAPDCRALIQFTVCTTASGLQQRHKAQILPRQYQRAPPLYGHLLPRVLRVLRQRRKLPSRSAVWSFRVPLLHRRYD